MTKDSMTTRRLSAQEFVNLGLAGMAYVKPKLVDGKRLYAIHTADGNEVAVAEDWDSAYATVRLNDLEPVAVH